MSVCLLPSALTPPQVVHGLKEELEVVQSERTRLQKEADTRVLAKSATMPPSSEGQGSGGGGVAHQGSEVTRPPYEQRSSGEVSIS